jgi:chorismate synthase
MKGDTVGGVVECVIRDVPPSLGDPVFDKLKATLAHAMMSLPAAVGFEVGEGFGSLGMKGSEHNDVFVANRKKNRLRSPASISTSTNHSGGIQGGISNGMPIVFRVCFKPVSTLFQEQETVTQEGKKTKLTLSGRHDPCVVPRAVVIVEAMAAIVLADHWMRQRAVR